MSEITIEVENREELGKNVNRRLRKGGLIPAVVYGGGLDPVAIKVDDKTVRTLLRSSAGENTVFLLKLEGTTQSRHAMIRDLQYEPTTGGLVHIDFQRINMADKIRVKVPVDLVGIPDGVKNEGGFLDFVTREVEIECLPSAIPNTLAIEVSSLHIGQHVEAKDIGIPDGVSLIDDEDRVIASVAQSRVAEEVEEEEVETLIEAEAEEPEVIGRAKAEEDQTEG